MLYSQERVQSWFEPHNCSWGTLYLAFPVQFKAAWGGDRHVVSSCFLPVKTDIPTLLQSFLWLWLIFLSHWGFRICLPCLARAKSLWLSACWLGFRCSAAEVLPLGTHLSHTWCCPGDSSGLDICSPWGTTELCAWLRDCQTPICLYSFTW